MNDPYVVSLIYRVEHGDTVNYEKTEPLHLENSEFCLTVENKQAKFDLKNYFATESEAREAMNAHVRAWKFDACLRHLAIIKCLFYGSVLVRFRYGESLDAVGAGQVHRT